MTGRGEWVGHQYLPVTKGVWRHRSAPDEFAATLRAWQAVLPDEWVFTHLTAARLRGWWLPPLPDDVPVFVAAPTSTGRVRRSGLVAIRRAQHCEPEVLDGIRVDSVPEVLANCARDLSVLDLTCLIDAALQNGCSFDRIRAAIRVRGKGAPALRAACDRARPGSESIWEVMLRELHRSCGVEVEPQHVVLDPGGRFVARGDLWLVGTRTLHEYDGSEHLARPRQQADLRRGRRLDASGWTRHGYTRGDVLHRAVTILADMDRAIDRDHDPSRIRAWHELLRESLFTPAGTALLRRRVGLSPEVVTRSAEQEPRTPSD